MNTRERNQMYKRFDLRNSLSGDTPHLIANGTITFDYVFNNMVNMTYQGKKVYSKKMVKEEFKVLKERVKSIMEYGS